MRCEQDSIGFYFDERARAYLRHCHARSKQIRATKT